ncbi:hypothetical protein ACLOJK_011302 [Asimina triloba]
MGKTVKHGGLQTSAAWHCGGEMDESSSKTSVVGRLLAVKERSGKSWSQIAAETGLTNVYVAQLFRRQACLRPDTAPILRAALPDLTDALVAEMMKPPLRSYDPNLIQDPAIYRLNEAVMHFGESIKDVINEDFGDGIMSAIDFYCSVDKIQGVDGKDRVVVTFDGKYLPHTEQASFCLGFHSVKIEEGPFEKLNQKLLINIAFDSFYQERISSAAERFTGEMDASSSGSSETRVVGLAAGRPIPHDMADNTIPNIYPTKIQAVDQLPDIHFEFWAAHLILTAEPTVKIKESCPFLLEISRTDDDKYDLQTPKPSFLSLPSLVSPPPAAAAAAAMAAIARAIISSTPRCYSPPILFLSKRLFSSPCSLSSPFLGFARAGTASLSHSLRPISLRSSRLVQVRCRVQRSGDSGYSPLNSGSNFSDRPPTEMAPLFPGCDYEHWLIVMDKPGGEGATKEQMIDCYIKTLAKVLGSEEEATKKIYNVSCERYFGFGCEIDEETSNKLEGLPGVLFVLPDSYVDPENKDYGAELFVNGQIVQRSPERQRRVEPVPQRAQDRPRYNDRTRYVRRRENQR